MEPDTVERPGACDEPAWLGRAMWAFVALGIALRVATYAANPPLWGDEACLAYNFLGRGFLDLLRPLDYGQVAPPLFLWIERAAVGLFGFSEPALRLFPLVCGVASVLLFRRLAGMMTRGVPAVLAVAVFAVSVHPIRHACDVKPYASDLLMAIVLLIPAFAWLRDRGRDRALWLLAGLAPVALLMSYPAAFIAGGIAIALAWPVWTSGRRSARLAFAAFGVAVAATALPLFAIVARGQEQAVRSWMDLYWSRAYPPSGVGPFLRWLVLSTTGSMLSYPDGGRDGGSIGTFVCVVVASWVLIRSRRRAELGLVLWPFGLTLLAAFGHRYPYGGEARTMQYVVPGVCLLMGLGLARLIRLGPLRSRASLRLALVLLTALGLCETAGFLRHPYRSAYDARARAFARGFWPAQMRDAEVACVRRDFGVVEDVYARRGILNGRTPVFVCNEGIYRSDRGPQLDRVSAAHPLRCVLYNESTPEQPEVAAWLDAMTARYDLARVDRLDVDLGEPGVPRVEVIRVYDFVPKGSAVARTQGATLR
jgi:4-amino-4-deoxy-L-arabinose transferase-like glycosyltransferase